ncbi:MAG: glycosyltransferase [Phycisphaerae bacterium]|nr:glycosyltransferase [Phycisphaerae bacterium]
MPEFSILVPCYNHAQYIGEALESVMAQTFEDWEAVVVDDGSTDDSGSVIDSYARRDPRIRAIHKRNGGTASALNAGLQHARGTWICWLSADDRFEPGKLAVHRAWIERFPACRFFHTHFRIMAKSGRGAEDPPLWRPVPDREWQVLEMLRGIFIHGNTVCIHREAFRDGGSFNERLRLGQDYDMWLRLLSRHPAEFIPERTHVQRVHGERDSRVLPEAGFFDCGWSAIEFLNAHAFDQLFPCLDLGKGAVAVEAVRKALDVAGDSQAPSLYGLGPHPALLWRVLEWAWRARTDASAEVINIAVTEGIETALSSDRLSMSARLQWKTAHAAFSLREGSLRYSAVSPAVVAEHHYWALHARRRRVASALCRYMGTRKWAVRSPIASLAARKRTGEIVLVCQEDERADAPPACESSQALRRLAKCCLRNGRAVVIVGRSEQRLGFTDGIPFAGHETESGLESLLVQLAPIQGLVALSRADVFERAVAEKPLLYQQQQCPAPGCDFVTTVTALRIPVVLPSQDALSMHEDHGIPSALLHVVPNGYDGDAFRGAADANRLLHSLVFWADGGSDKGVDIAVRAFERLRASFPDARLDVYGHCRPWDASDAHLWQDGWLDDKGVPDWRLIEKALPGLKYCGEATPHDMAGVLRARSCLVRPSRIREVSGAVSLEAQACGCIPVLPRRGAFPETVWEGVTGHLYDDHSPEGMAACLEALWKERLPSEAQRATAMTWVRENFSWPLAGRLVLSVLDAVPSHTRRAHKLARALWRLERCVMGRPCIRAWCEHSLLMKKLVDLPFRAGRAVCRRVGAHGSD